MMPNLPSLVTKLDYLAQSVASYATTSSCPHCGGEKHSVVGRKYGVARVARCESCGLKFTRPIYRPSYGKDFYDSMYVGQGSTTVLPSRDELEQLKRTVFVGTDKDARLPLERIRAVAGGDESLTLLELGSSWGYFLYQAQHAGFRAQGVEVATRRRAFGVSQLGVHIAPSLGDVAAGDGFDVVYTAHVLEHFTDISSIFRTLAEKMRPGAHLFVEVPNVDLDAVGRRALRWMGAVHPLGFDAAFFRHNLPRHGFEAVAAFEDWGSMPDRPVERSTAAVVIVHARRASA